MKRKINIHLQGVPLQSCKGTPCRIYYILFIVFLVYSVTFSYFSIRRHDAFFSGFDLSNMDQTVWNTLNGRFFTLTQDESNVSRFAIHSDLILVLLTPLYLIWNNVRMLLIFQSVALASAILPVYLIGKKVLKNNTLALFPVIVYVLNPGLHWVNIYDFHPVALAIPLIFTAVYFFLSRRWKLFALVSILILITKEDLGIIVALLSVCAAIFGKKYRLGMLLAAVGVLWTIAMVFAVMPMHYFKGEHWAWDWFRIYNPHKGKNVLELRKSWIIHELFQNPNSQRYYLSLLKTFSFLPLLGAPWLLFTVPQLLINTLSSQEQMATITLHYDSAIIPFLAIAFIYGLKFINRLTDMIKSEQLSKKIILCFGGTLILFAVRDSFANSPLPWSPNCFCQMFEVTKAEKDFETILSGIPQNASITASSEIRPHITHREFAFTIPNATGSAQYIAFTSHNRIVGNTQKKEVEEQILLRLTKDLRYRNLYSDGQYWLFQKL